MSVIEDRSQQLIRGLRDGDGGAAWELWQRFGGALNRLADKHLSPGLRRRVEPEDVVQSACRTFFRRARDGEFYLENGEGVWQVLRAITLTKVREQARYHLRHKRGVDRETPLAPAPTDSAVVGLDPADPNPNPAEAAASSELIERFLASLDDEERRIVELKLEGLTHDEVAERLDSSERTVRRVVKRLGSRLARVLERDGAAAVALAPLPC